LAPTDIAILTGAALVTSAVTATLGLGGGIILLVVMLLYLDPLVAIPVHGVIQLISNSSRTVIQRRHVRWEILWRYSLPLLPMGYVGLAFARSLSPDTLKVGIGLFVLAATWIPGRFRPRGRSFVGLGAVVGLLNPTVGATGPLVGPFFRNLGLSRQGVVGTFAACQTAGHLAKIVVFGTVGFAFAAYLLPIGLMSAGVMVGTWLGSLLLDRIDETLFRRLYRVVLTLIALRLILWDGLHLF
jgi:uncharacterized membrane protein YfcA